MDTNLCPFCNKDEKLDIIREHGTVAAIKDKYPVAPGHLLVITKRHTADFFTMTERERNDAARLILLLRESIAAADPTVSGFNIGVNCGETAGQTIMHAHIHVIPRRKGDSKNPRGGVRGVIPGKMSY